MDNNTNLFDRIVKRAILKAIAYNIPIAIFLYLANH